MGRNILEDFIHMSDASAEVAGALVDIWLPLFMGSQHLYSRPRFPAWQLGPKKENAENTRPVNLGLDITWCPFHHVILVKAGHKPGQDSRDGDQPSHSRGMG